MNAMIVLIAAALFIGLGGLAVLLVVLSGRQYEDLDGAAERILIPDEDDTCR